MVYKLAHEAEISNLPSLVPGKLYDSLLEFLLVLDNEYGADRNVEQDDGGYVLFCTPGTTDNEIQRYFHFNGLISDWVTSISHDPDYCASAYFLRDDYVVILIRAENERKNG